jgi:hypothetical protein
MRGRRNKAPIHFQLSNSRYAIASVAIVIGSFHVHKPKDFATTSKGG